MTDEPGMDDDDMADEPGMDDDGGTDEPGRDDDGPRVVDDLGLDGKLAELGEALIDAARRLAAFAAGLRAVLREAAGPAFLDEIEDSLLYWSDAALAARALAARLVAARDEAVAGLEAAERDLRMQRAAHDRHLAAALRKAAEGEEHGKAAMEVAEQNHAQALAEERAKAAEDAARAKLVLDERAEALVVMRRTHDLLLQEERERHLVELAAARAGARRRSSGDGERGPGLAEASGGDGAVEGRAGP